MEKANSSLIIEIPEKDYWNIIQGCPIDFYKKFIGKIDCDTELTKKLITYAQGLYWDNQKDKLEVIIEKIHSIEKSIIVPILHDAILLILSDGPNSERAFVPLWLKLINPEKPPEELADCLIDLYLKDDNHENQISEILYKYTIDIIAPRIYHKVTWTKFDSSKALRTCSKIIAKWNAPERKIWYMSLLNDPSNIYWVQDEMMEILPEETLDYFINKLPSDGTEQQIWKKILKIKTEILMEKVDRILKLLPINNIKPTELTQIIGVSVMRKHVDKLRKDILIKISRIEKRLNIELEKTKSLPVLEYIRNKSTELKNTIDLWIFWEDYYRKIS